MLKKCLCLLLVVMMLFGMSGCKDTLSGIVFLFLVATGDDRADQGEIFDFVCENEEELRIAIENGDFSDFENQGIIKDIVAEQTVVDFSCGGAGIGSGTSYVGFYYTPDNDMTAVWCAPSSVDAMTPSGDGYAWQEPNGDNYYYTERICECFYYYEASF